MDFPLFGELIVGGIKIKDGLFIGDTYAAQDIEFIFNNKITHIINCSSNEVPNYFEAQGIEYLSIPWEETDSQILFDQRGQTVEIICQFIEKGRRLGESVLVHSVKGQSRASCAICAYFMKRFRWGFYKTLEFLDSRRPDLEIRRNFFEQLKILADGIGTHGEVSNNWDVIISNDPDIKREELIIRNTFFNSKIENKGPNIYAQRKKSRGKKKKEKRKRKIKWVDKISKKKTTITDVLPYTDEPLTLRHRRNSAASYSILKTSPKSSHNARSKRFSDQILENKKIMRTEPDNRRRNANNISGMTSASRKRRPNSSSKRKDDSSFKPLSKAKRLLNDHKKKRKKLYQSNSSKRLEVNKGSASAKRGSTPRRRKESGDSRKKISNSFSRNKDKKKETSHDKKLLSNFNRPPLAKKKNLNSALEKYKNENLLSMIVGKKNQKSASKKKKNKSKMERLITEDTMKGNSLSKNSTNIPDDSKDMKNNRKLRPGSAKLSKLSSLQPRYKIDENFNNSNSHSEKPSMSNNNRLVQMIANPKELKNFHGTLGENYLNISNNDRKKFQEKVANGRYNIEAFRANMSEKASKAGVLLKNDNKSAVRAHKIKTANGSLFDFSKYSNFVKTGNSAHGPKAARKADIQGKLKKVSSKPNCKNKRPNSAPIKDLKKKKELENKRNAKIFKNLMPGYGKKMGKMSKNFGNNKFFKGKNLSNIEPNSIYTGPVIKKKMLN